MRNVFTALVIVLFAITAFAQSPEKMSYQAIIRNASNNLVAATTVDMQISILQGSSTGPVVYVETQTPTTNSNGLVSIEIGGGTVVRGSFANIDWASGPYFIKTETDPDGAANGISYTITGISQLMSVPYALYAKTAGSTLGTSVEHYVGELYGGGVVFKVDHTGQHGLIVSMIDLSDSQIWSNIRTPIGTLNDWDGVGNTSKIIKQRGHTNSAAKLCDDYTNADYGTGVYSDWYLPSVYELNDLWKNINNVTKALDTDGNSTTTAIVKNSSSYYLSSSESPSTNAWSYFFFLGGTYDVPKDNTSYVRAVRSF